MRRLVERILHPGCHSSATIWAVLILLVVVVVIVVPDFIYPANIFNVLIQIVPLGLASIGQTRAYNRREASTAPPIPSRSTSWEGRPPKGPCCVGRSCKP